MKVLLADDSKSIRMMLEAQIRAAGHDVVCASNGREAVHAFEREHPDVCLLDVVMPGVDGYEAARQVRALCDERGDWVPIIFLSAMVSAADIVKGIECGGDDYLTKPVNALVLNAKLGAMSRIAQMRHALAVANEQLRKISEQDALTGIANRRHFDACLDREWQRASSEGTPISLAIADIDFFKGYNDNYGHPAGDACLRSVATGLRVAAGLPPDLPARIGGEEFALLLPGKDADGAMEAAERARLAVLALRITHGHSEVSAWVTVSLGVATVTPAAGGCTAKGLLELADQGLYAAKRSGRNRVCRGGESASST